MVNFIGINVSKIIYDPDKIKLNLMSQVDLKNIFAHYCKSDIAVGSFSFWKLNPILLSHNE